MEGAVEEAAVEGLLWAVGAHPRGIDGRDRRLGLFLGSSASGRLRHRTHRGAHVSYLSSLLGSG